MGGAGCCDDKAFGAECASCGVSSSHPAHLALEWGVLAADSKPGLSRFWRTAAAVDLFNRSAAAKGPIPEVMADSIAVGSALGLVFGDGPIDERAPGLQALAGLPSTSGGAATPRPIPSTSTTGGGGSQTPANPPPDHTYAEPEPLPTPILGPPDTPAKVPTCCCNAVSLTLQHKKGPPTRKRGVFQSTVTVKWKVEIVGDKTATKILPCTFEWWEIHNKMTPNTDDDGTPFPYGWWANLMEWGKWAVLDDTKKFFSGMTCATKEDGLSASFVDTPQTRIGFLNPKAARWGIVVLKSGCPNGPTKRRYWYSGMKKGRYLVIWPPEESGPLEDKPAPDIGDDHEPPFKGPPDPPLPKPKRPLGNKAKYPDVPKKTA